MPCSASVELPDVVARGGVRHHSCPGLKFLLHGGFSYGTPRCRRVSIILWYRSWPRLRRVLPRYGRIPSDDRRRSAFRGTIAAWSAGKDSFFNLEVNVMLVRVGSSKDVAAGKMRVFDVAGTKVNVTNADGHWYAFDDTCTHLGCSLAKGTLDGTTVTCRCHGSQFDVTSGA